MLPKDFSPWQAVYWWFRCFVRRMLFRAIHDVALMIDRGAAVGRRALRLVSASDQTQTPASIISKPRNHGSGASTRRLDPRGFPLAATAGTPARGDAGRERGASILPHVPLGSRPVPKADSRDHGRAAPI